MGSYGNHYVRTQTNGEIVDIHFINGKFVIYKKDDDISCTRGNYL